VRGGTWLLALGENKGGIHSGVHTYDSIIYFEQQQHKIEY